MLALLLSYGAKLLARPALLVGLASALTIGWLQFSHGREVKALKATITATEQALTTERLALAEHKVALSDVQANRDALASELRRQNDAIGALHLQMTAKETEASIAAVRAFNQGRSVAESLRQPTTSVPPGHAGMNTWLTDRFGGAP